jgi:hypothetical protein
MHLFWRIRYLDTRDRQFKDRDLWLDTDALDPLMKAAVEATHHLRDIGRAREILRYRHLFQERNHTGEDLRALWERNADIGNVFLHDCFEDEAGEELTYQRMGAIVTGDPQAAFFPPGMRQHDVEFCFAENTPIDLAQVTLSPEQLKALGYFIRDLRELVASAFYKDGPGSLSSSGTDGRWGLKTAVSDEEIRSFVTIFRRLYMDGEPGSFIKAAAAFSEALPGHPLANWVRGTASEYERELEREPDSARLIGQADLRFSRGRLIDVFIYTQYAHQPNERRTRQFQECVAAVGGSRTVLTWLFLTEVWKCALQMSNAGAIMAEFYDRYCRCHDVPCGVLASLRSDHPGLGVLEKKEAQAARVLREKAEELAKALWERSGRPEGGHTPFIKPALERLLAATGVLGRYGHRLQRRVVEIPEPHPQLQAVREQDGVPELHASLRRYQLHLVVPPFEKGQPLLAQRMVAPHLVDPRQPVVQDQKLPRRGIELDGQHERRPPAGLPLRVRLPERERPEAPGVSPHQELGMEPGEDRLHDPGVVQVEPLLHLPKPGRELRQDALQVFRVLPGALLQFLLGGEGDPVILGTEAFEQVRGEVVHRLLLAFRSSVS